MAAIFLIFFKTAVEMPLADVQYTVRTYKRRENNTKQTTEKKLQTSGRKRRIQKYIITTNENENENENAARKKNLNKRSKTRRANVHKYEERNTITT